MKPFSLIIQQAKPSLTIKKKEGQHKLEIAKAIIVSGSPTLDKDIADLQTKDTALDKDIADLKTKDTALDKDIADLKTKDTALDKDIADLKTKDTALDKDIADLKVKDTALDKDIADLKVKDTALDKDIADLKVKDTALDAKMIALEAREDVKIRFYQGDAPADTEPLAVGVTLFDKTFEVYRYIDDEEEVLIRSGNFSYRNLDYSLEGIYYYFSSKSLHIEFRFPQSQNISKNLNNLCIAVGDQMFMMADGKFTGRTISGTLPITFEITWYINTETSPFRNRLKARIRIEPLLWTSEVPAYAANKKLYQATKTPAGWQVVRVQHPDQ